MIGHGSSQGEPILPTIIRPDLTLQKYRENTIVVPKTLFFTMCRVCAHSDSTGTHIVEPSSWR